MNNDRIPLKMISFYQRKISPLFPPRCRYYPTCSQYTYEAIERYGFFAGSALGALRLFRCNPLFPGGVDPVPQFKKIKYRNHKTVEQKQTNDSQL